MSSEAARYGDPKTRQGVLQATWDLIDEHGSAPSLTDVADRAGVSRQAVYLHFGGRAGLLVALVEYMDETLGLDRLAAEVLDAPSGVEALQRMVQAVSGFTPKIDSVARVLEAAQHQDEAVATAWRNRMRGRQSINRAIIQRIADDGQLAEGWTVKTAADLCYTLTMPGLWRELTQERGWTPQQYAENLTRLLRSSLTAD